MKSNIDRDSGIIYLHGEVDTDMYATCSRGLSDLGQLHSEITIVLNTEGGDLYQALAIYDLIRLSESQGVLVKILCCGPVMSAGTVILSASSQRVATPNTQFMIHYGEEYNDAPSSVKHNKHLFKLMKQIIGSRVKISSRKLTNWFNQDTYLTADEALECGLIDRITS